MEISFNLTAALLLLSALLAFSMALFLTFKGKKSSAQHSFIWVNILIFVWSTGEFLRGITENDRLWSLFLMYEYLGVCFIGACWLVFCLEFIKAKNNDFNYIRAILIFTPCLIFYLSLLTNKYHHLFFPIYDNDDLSFGVIFWLHTVFAYSCSLIGMIILIRYSIKKYEMIKKQAIIIVLAVLISIATNALLLTDYINPGVDITPVSFMVTLLLFMLATFRYRFLSIVPIALRKVFDSMKEAVIVIDGFNRISDFNKSYLEVFQQVPIERDDNINSFIEKITGFINRNRSSDELLNAISNGSAGGMVYEINLVMPESRWFSVNIQHIWSKRKRIVGTIIVFSNITEHKSMLEELCLKNEELIALNEELKGYADTIEELAIAKERNRFARDVHDSLGHTMTLLLKLNEASIIASESNPEKMRELLSEAYAITIEGLQELKRSISGLKPHKLESGDLIESLNNLSLQVKLSNVNVELNVEGWDETKYSAYSVLVFRICQEAMTNSIRHGKASEINVFIRITGNTLSLFVIDNGQGCKDITEGQGLTGMRERVAVHNGKFAFSSDGETGFIIRAEIPLEGGESID